MRRNLGGAQLPNAADRKKPIHQMTLCSVCPSRWKYSRFGGPRDRATGRAACSRARRGHYPDGFRGTISCVLLLPAPAGMIPGPCTTWRSSAMTAPVLRRGLPNSPTARAAAVTETLCPGQTRPGTRRPLAAPGGLISQAARRSDFRGPYRTNTLAWPARSRKYCGATPSTSVTATPTAIAVDRQRRRDGDRGPVRSRLAEEHQHDDPDVEERGDRRGDHTDHDQRARAALGRRLEDRELPGEAAGQRDAGEGQQEDREDRGHQRGAAAEPGPLGQVASPRRPRRGPGVTTAKAPSVTKE